MFEWKNVVVPPEGHKTFERRATQRFRVGLKVTLVRLNQGKVCRCLTEDLSAGGLRFLSSVPLALGETIEVTLPLDVDGQYITIGGRVTWCRGTPESPLGVYEGGIAFTRISARSHARLTRFLAELQTPQVAEAEA
ncbi:MAG TPA: PilZ domain-containing protein [Candidatus Xenobia bacterium]|jgi:c-di-GMP-binding flagellar brake protein YcgR